MKKPAGDGAPLATAEMLRKRVALFSPLLVTGLGFLLAPPYQVFRQLVDWLG